MSTPATPTIVIEHSAKGVVVKILQPQTRTYLCADIPINLVLDELLPAILAAIDAHAREQNIADAVNAAFTEFDAPQ